MKHILVLFLAGAVFAAPCVTDVFSTEPSPLAGAAALATGGV